MAHNNRKINVDEISEDIKRLEDNLELLKLLRNQYGHDIAKLPPFECSQAIELDKKIKQTRSEMILLTREIIVYDQQCAEYKNRNKKFYLLPLTIHYVKTLGLLVSVPTVSPQALKKLPFTAAKLEMGLREKALIIDFILQLQKKLGIESTQMKNWLAGYSVVDLRNMMYDLAAAMMQP